MVKIKNPFGSLQTSPQADAWWVALIFFLEKHVFVKHPTVHCVCLNRAQQRIRDLIMAPVCRFSHGSQQLHYTNPPSSLSTLKTEIKKERLKLGLCASLLVPSSIDGWVHSEGESLLRGERKETRKKQASSKGWQRGERDTLRRMARRPL